MAYREGEERQLIDGREVIVIRSAKRKRTISADLVGGTLRLRVPLRMGKGHLEEHARAFQQKLRKKAAGRERSDEALMQRALELSKKHFDDAVRPVSVRWSDRQNTRWGSTTSSQGTIRLSSRLKEMPGWVQDGVLVHELAHLIEPGHGPAFRRLVERYPHTKESDAFLEGVSFAQRQMGQA